MSAPLQMSEQFMSQLMPYLIAKEHHEAPFGETFRETRMVFGWLPLYQQRQVLGLISKSRAKEASWIFQVARSECKQCEELLARPGFTLNEEISRIRGSYMAWISVVKDVASRDFVLWRTREARTYAQYRRFCPHKIEEVSKLFLCFSLSNYLSYQHRNKH